MKNKQLSRVVTVSARVSKVKERQIKQRCLATGESVSDVINASLIHIDNWDQWENENMVTCGQCHASFALLYTDEGLCKGCHESPLNKA